MTHEQAAPARADAARHETSPRAGHRFVRSWTAALGEAWSTTRFRGHDLSSYAKDLMVDETRKGVRVMCVAFLLLLIASTVVAERLGIGGKPYWYTSVALGALAIHVSFAARAIRDIRALHLLGMTLLTISGSAFVLLAHRTGAFGTALFSSTVLLFMVVPMVPWGLREASLVTLLIYGLFSSSLWGVGARFDAQTLWALQVFMLTAAAISLTLVARGATVRRADISARWALESARREMERLSYRDPLTGVGNRRFLQSEFPAWLERVRKAGASAHVALLDLDHFKRLNDGFGHTFGDEVLRAVARAFEERIGEAGHLVRTGGDEFTLLLASDDPEAMVAEAIEALQPEVRRSGQARAPRVSMSVGLVTVPERGRVDLDAVYRAADAALYQAKGARSSAAPGASCLIRAAMPRTIPAGDAAAPEVSG